MRLMNLIFQRTRAHGHRAMATRGIFGNCSICRAGCILRNEGFAGAPMELRQFQLILLTGGVVLAAAAAPALAQIEQQVARCQSPHDAVAADLRIESCTWAIQSGRWSGTDLAFAYFNRGNAYFENKEHGRAIADFSEAIRLDPGFARTYNNRGFTYSVKGDYDNAIADYGEAIRLDPKYALAYYNRAGAYRIKGDFERAIADYDEAISSTQITPWPVTTAASRTSLGRATTRPLQISAKQSRLNPILPRPASTENGRTSVRRKKNPAPPINAEIGCIHGLLSVPPRGSFCRYCKWTAAGVSPPRSSQAGLHRRNAVANLGQEKQRIA